ncbi:MAG: glycoside hydrolase family 20 zincin-like fold domain-containing protein, partial [Vulcanimicrobiaceae bacterium]
RLAGTASFPRVALVLGGASAPRGPQSYRLRVDRSGIAIAAADSDGAFYALATLAQLAVRSGGRVLIPCVAIADAPALRWRILSDDVSRGPIPTMSYFELRIRTLAAFKMNGYSPYMESVFADPRQLLPAPRDGIAPAQLRTLAHYARRFHVALIPEQQTFAHMHGTLRLERYAALAETPHGYLLAPANPGGLRYARDLIEDELAATGPVPFFHIGSDEPFDLGRGQSAALVAREGAGRVYAAQVSALADLVLAAGARPLVWDDALAAHPELFGELPKRLVFVTWHYEPERSYERFIEPIARAGFAQLVAPGDDNWNELYPDLERALPSIATFVSNGKQARVLGLFQTVWNDDGETLFDATWYPVFYAAANAWEQGAVSGARFGRDFAPAFFASDDPGYARDFRALARARDLLRSLGDGRPPDALYWADPFAPAIVGRDDPARVAALRLAAESVLAHLRRVPPPPLHANAAAAMELGAARYDVLGRDLQIAREARATYDEARAAAARRDEPLVERDLNVVTYDFWEMRDMQLDLLGLVRRTWLAENRPHHLASVLERYHLAADRAIARADRVVEITYDDAVAGKPLPPFDSVLGFSAPASDSTASP